MRSEYDRPAGGRWKYNPPPTWPAAPSGWAPWPGWEPPAEWAPAPVGWAFWVRERPWPVRHPVWTSAAAVFALLMVVGAVAGDPQPAAPRLADAAAAVTPAAVPASTSAAPSATPSATPSVTPSVTPSPTPSATPSAAPSARPAAPRVAVPAVPYYPNCAAARAAGKAPLHRGQPGYRTGLDGDADGVACEAGSGAGAPPARTTVPPARKTTPPPAPPAPPAEVYYANCAAAKAAGAAPLYRGQPGYRSRLDGDGDGVACEK